MVNIGRSSKGCLTCRRSRVKCDETRPRCTRCVKLRIDCEWRDDWDVMVRPQEKWAKKTVMQRVERVKVLRNEKASTGLSAKEFLKAVILPKQPQIGPEIFAINRFYKDYAYTMASCQFLYTVQLMWGRKDTPVSLQSIISAVALANAAKKMGRYDLMEEAHRHYGQSLKAMTRVLTKPEVIKHDGTLITALMLSLYESIACDRMPGGKDACVTHTSGHLALLKLRGPDQLKTASGCNLFMVLHHMHLATSLMNGSEPDVELHSWMYGVFPVTPLIAMMHLMHDISSFLFLLKKELKRKPTTNSMEIADMLQHGQRLHELSVDLIKFFIHGDEQRSEAMRFYVEADSKRKHSSQNKVTPMSLKDDLKANEIAATNAKEESGTHAAKGVPVYEASGPEMVHVKDHTSVRHNSANFSHINTAQLTALNVSRAMHICLLQGLLAAISYLRQNHRPPPSHSGTNPILNDLEDSEREFNATISHHAIGINRDVPGATDGKGLSTSEYRLRGSAFRAYVMVWPLTTALMASQTEYRYKVLLARRLMDINKIHGIGMAAEMVAMANLPNDEGVQGDDEESSPRHGDVDARFEGKFGGRRSQCFCLFIH